MCQVIEEIQPSSTNSKTPVTPSRNDELGL